MTRRKSLLAEALPERAQHGRLIPGDMLALFAIFAGALGAVVGSFLSVVAERLPKGEDIVWRRSHCPRCGAVLGIGELIPVVSFFWQRGRCRQCARAIGWRYPFLEIAAAGFFAITAYGCGLTLSGCIASLPVPFWWFFGSILLLIGVIDFAHLVIPESLLGAGMLVAIVGRGIFAPQTLFNAIAAALVGGVFFWLIVRVSHERWMGAGDAALGALLGMMLGFPLIVVALTASSLLGGIGAILLLSLGRKTFGAVIPYAPFLAAGAFLAIIGRVFVNFWPPLF